MTKYFMKGMAALCVCAAFASCSHDPGFDVPNQFELTKNEYKANFIKKYGEINPNQTWDFTDLTKSSSTTRAEVSVSTLYLYNGFQSSVSNDKKIVEQQTDFTTGITTFNPYFAASLFAAFSHAKADVKFNYYHLEICQNGVYTEVPAQINVKNGFWYDRGTNGSLNQNSGRSVDTRSLTGENIYWVAYPTCPGYSSEDKAWNEYVASHKEEYKIEDYKILTVNGRTYWCFDVDKDGDYSDLLFQVVSHEPAAPVWKRYMIEDLGGKDDFDFNDIVVDVIQDFETSSQKAIVRAMGGTLDFTLKIGNTSWSKTGAGFVEGTMYNTQPTPDWDKVLAEFDVTGWVPSANNISVTVNSKDNNGVLTEVNIPFPKQGEVPMIIAVYPLLVDWMTERTSIPTDFFYEIPEAE